MANAERTEPLPKQLYMVADAAAIGLLPPAAVPTGYALRPYRQGDEEGWTETLNLSGFTDWDLKSVVGYLEEPERREGSRVVEREGEIVAATFASRLSNTPPGPPRSSRDDPSREGVLDYVATRPDHQGRGLGRATCTGVAGFLVSRGCDVVSLTTDDWRLPAIHIYLSMGFRPVMDREDMPGRWASVLARMGEGGREYT
jgi:mycothiol synthase